MTDHAERSRDRQSRARSSAGAEASGPAVRLSGVTKSFGETVAVRDLDLVVPQGSIYGLLGPNGAGKTTTIRIILDILGPDSGTVEVLGRTIDDEIRTRVGYLPEERGLYQKMKVVDHLAFLGVLKGMARSEAKTEGRRWLERLDLEEWADKEVDTLSKGMEQKVQFIATVLHRPDLLILDEPFGGLDPINVAVLKQIVLEENRRGATVIFSTHMIEDAERLCDRVCMIAGARKVLDGRVSDVKAEAGAQEVILDVEGDGAFVQGSPLVKKVVEHGRYVEVRMAEGADPQALLRLALEADVEVRRFELALPSLRDIFLERAGEKGLEEEAREEDPISRVPSLQPSEEES